MYKEIEQVKSFEEIEEILFKHADDYQFIDSNLKSLEHKNIVKKLGARYLIKKSILDYLGLEDYFNDIDIENEESGKPVVSFKGFVDEKLKEQSIKNVQVSISHSRNYVTTLVILE